MASSSTGVGLSSAIDHPVTEKLTKTNFALWKLQVLPAIRGAQLMGYIDGTEVAPPHVIMGGADGKEKVANPKYAELLAKDQQVFSYLVSSLHRDVLAQVSTAVTARHVWETLETMFASQVRARAVNTRIALATTKKGALTVTEYVTKMRALGDEMAAASKPLDDEELVSYIVTGLDIEFNPVVSAVLARVEPISVTDLYTQLLAFEQRMDLLHGASGGSVNSASRGRGNGGRSGYRGGRANHGRGSGGRGRGNSNGKPKIKCQLCKKDGHAVVDCWYRFEENFVVPEERSANAAGSSNYGNNYGMDTNWYTDSGATDHITGELDKMVIRDRYNGGDQIHAANGAGSSHKENPAGRNM